MIEPPADVVPDSPLKGWLRKLRMFCVSLRLLPGPGYRVKRSPSGITLVLEPQAGGGGAVSGLRYRGTYRTDVHYLVNDIVRSQSAPHALGVFICVRDNPVSGASNIGPTYPEPADTGGTNTWELWTLGVKVYTSCKAGESTVTYINLMEV